jgi:hypothetical protein
LDGPDHALRTKTIGRYTCGSDQFMGSEAMTETNWLALLKGHAANLMTKVKAWVTRVNWLPIMRVIEFIGMATAIIVVLWDFTVDRPIDRAVRKATLFAQLAQTHELGPTGLRALRPTILALLEEGIPIHNQILSGVDLSGAEMEYANFSRSDLTGAMLAGANLTGADLSRADLSGANLSGANLTGADLSRAGLMGANLTGANLTGVNFERATDIPDLSDACADPNNPPTSLPDDVTRPDPWAPCLEK